MKRKNQGNGKSKGRRKCGSTKRKVMRAIRLKLKISTHSARSKSRSNATRSSGYGGK